MIAFTNALGWISGSCLVLALILGLIKFSRDKKNRPDPPDYFNSVPFITFADCELLIVLAAVYAVAYFIDKRITKESKNGDL